MQGNNLYRYSGPDGLLEWSSVGTVSYAAAGNSAELIIDRNALGDPAQIDVLFIGSNSAAGSGDTPDDAYPDGVYDNGASLRHFGYAFGGTANVSSAAPVVSAATSAETACVNTGVAIPIDSSDLDNLGSGDTSRGNGTTDGDSGSNKPQSLITTGTGPVGVWGVFFLLLLTRVLHKSGGRLAVRACISAGNTKKRQGAEIHCQ